jgi:hypothetical protein
LSRLFGGKSKGDCYDHEELKDLALGLLSEVLVSGDVDKAIFELKDLAGKLAAEAALDRIAEKGLFEEFGPEAI